MVAAIMHMLLLDRGGNVTTGTAAITQTTTRAYGTNDGVHPGFQFTATVTGMVLSTTFDVAAVVSTQTWHAELWSNNAGSPGSQIGVDSDGVSVSAAGVATFTFATPPVITGGTVYWMVFQPGATAPDILSINCGADTAGYGSGRNTTITSIADNLGVELKIGIAQFGS